MAKLATTLKDITKEAQLKILALEEKKNALILKQKRIETQKAKILKLKREEKERKKREIEKLQKIILSTAKIIYTKILNAAWDGNDYAAVDPKYAEYQSELTTYNIIFFDHNQKISELNKLVNIFKNISTFDKKVKLRILSSNIEDVNFYFYGKGKIQLKEITNSLNFELTTIQNKKIEVNKKISTLLNSLERDDENLSKYLLKLKTLISKNKAIINNEATRRQEYENAKIKIRANLNEINGRYQSSISNKNLSIAAKSDILRNIYKHYLGQLNFDHFNILEIINLIREAANQAPLDIPMLGNNHITKLDLEIGELELNINKIYRKINSNERNLEIFKGRIIHLSELVKKIKMCNLEITKLNKNILLFNNLLINKEIQIKNNSYVSKCLVKISEGTIITEKTILEMQEAISYLKSVSGKNLKEKLILALEKTAKKSINITHIFTHNHEDKLVVKINNTKFYCKIKLNLLIKVLKDTGLNVKKIQIDNLEALHLSW